VGVSDAAAAVLLAVGVLVELSCCVGVLLMRDAYDKLHYTGPAAILGPAAVAAAIVIREGVGQAGIKAVLVALLLIVANPVLAHATGRALYIRQRDHLEPESTGPAPGSPA
jgi:monovalent cation/proton antiporter MnhG/PhaG subunit